MKLLADKHLFNFPKRVYNKRIVPFILFFNIAPSSEFRYSRIISCVSEYWVGVDKFFNSLSVNADRYGQSVGRNFGNKEVLGTRTVRSLQRRGESAGRLSSLVSST